MDIGGVKFKIKRQAPARVLVSIRHHLRSVNLARVDKIRISRQIIRLISVVRKIVFIHAPNLAARNDRLVVVRKSVVYRRKRQNVQGNQEAKDKISEIFFKFLHFRPLDEFYKIEV